MEIMEWEVGKSKKKTSAYLPLDQGTGGGWMWSCPTSGGTAVRAYPLILILGCCVLSICSRVAREHQVAELCCAGCYPSESKAKAKVNPRSRSPHIYLSIPSAHSNLLCSRFRRRLQSARACWLQVAPAHHQSPRPGVCGIARLLCKERLLGRGRARKGWACRGGCRPTWWTWCGRCSPGGCRRACWSPTRSPAACAPGRLAPSSSAESNLTFGGNPSSLLTPSFTQIVFWRIHPWIHIALYCTESLNLH